MREFGMAFPGNGVQSVQIKWVFQAWNQSLKGMAVGCQAELWVLGFSPPSHRSEMQYSSKARFVHKADTVQVQLQDKAAF